jgi:hypothetical protein
MNEPPSKRKLFIIVSAIDAFLSGILLLIFFGFLPVDISKWGYSREVVGWVAGIWFFSALVILIYQLTRTDISE